jgi:hypothetical protein
MQPIDESSSGTTSQALRRFPIADSASLILGSPRFCCLVAHPGVHWLLSPLHVLPDSDPISVDAFLWRSAIILLAVAHVKHTIPSVGEPEEIWANPKPKLVATLRKSWIGDLAARSPSHNGLNNAAVAAPPAAQADMPAQLRSGMRGSVKKPKSTSQAFQLIPGDVMSCMPGRSSR